MLRPEDEFHYYLCLQVANSFGHHRIVAYGKQKYSFVPHSHAILTLFLVLLDFCPFSYEFAYMPFLLNFTSGSSIP